MTVYLDYVSTTPVDENVANLVYDCMINEFGNPGSLSHKWGKAADRIVKNARIQISNAVKAKSSEVVFTSGATESNNLALLGLKDYGIKHNKKHIISTALEHKSVSEPLKYLESVGFEISRVYPNKDGEISISQIENVLRTDTLLVSTMHVNNEVGLMLPVKEIAGTLQGHDAFYHVDAAQGFGKYNEDLSDRRIDMISISGHKIYAPKGIGALVMRKRSFKDLPISPIFFGGGQEKGLRSGTLAVPLIAGLGLASELAVKKADSRVSYVKTIKSKFTRALSQIGAQVHGLKTSDFMVNFSIPGNSSEEILVHLEKVAAISAGSACTSYRKQELSPSLSAMGLSEETIRGAVRVSWSHLTPEFEVEKIISSLINLVKNQDLEVLN